MDKINQYKRTKFEDETSNEFYLNPKDLSINDRISDISNLVTLLSYLKYNELLIILFDQNIVIIDIKKSISSNLTIIKHLNINEIYNSIFPQIKKVTDYKIIVGNNFSNFCFRNKENDLKLIKNFKCFENKKELNKIYLMFEFYNLDFTIITFDNVQINSKYKIIYKHQKNFWCNKNLKMNYEINLIYNYYSYIKIIQDNEKTNLFYLCENYIFSFVIDNTKDILNFKHKIKIENEIKFFELKKLNNFTTKYIFITINNSNIIKGNILDITNEKIYDSKNLNNYNEGLISFYFISESKFIYSQLNIVYIYKIEENDKERIKYNLIHKITFLQFEDWNIKFIFLTRNDLLFVFNSNADYSIQDLNKVKNINNVNNNSIFSLSILKLIYDIKEFETKIGFFIIGTQNQIKNLNINITYFIPNDLSNLLIKNRDKFLFNNISKDKFYTEQLCEKIIFQIRFPNDKENKQEDNSNINKKRVMYYINSLFNDKQNDSNIKNDIINLYREKNKINSEYNTYLNNKDYICEFCNEKFISFKPKLNSYQCLSNHETYYCCITYKPLNDKCYQCQKCKLFYSPDSKNLKICLICQQMLKPI